MRKVLKSSRADKHVPFEKGEILKIVGLIESGVPRRDILKEHGMHSSTLTIWLNRYGSPSYQAGRRRPYSPSQQRSVLRAVESGMSVREACSAFGIPARSVVDRWLRAQKAENAELSSKATIVKKKEETRGTAPEDTGKSLEQELAEARLKIRALETMIDIAEEHLKIDIRKKSGAKQSAK